MQLGKKLCSIRASSGFAAEAESSDGIRAHRDPIVTNPQKALQQHVRSKHKLHTTPASDVPDHRMVQVKNANSRLRVSLGAITPKKMLLNGLPVPVLKSRSVVCVWKCKNSRRCWTVHR